MRYGRNFFAEEISKIGIPRLMLSLNTRFFLRQNVQPEILLTALRDTLKLYPVFGFTFEQEGDKIYFADDDEPVSVYETDRIHVPDQVQFGRHLFFVGYFGNMISISVDHRLSDGSGVQLFFGKMLERYSQLLSGTAEEITGPAYDVSLMLRQKPDIPHNDYRLYKPFTCDGEMLRLPAPTMGKPYRSFICRVDEQLFMDYVRRHDTTALAAISQITDKGIFSLDSFKGDYIRTDFVISTKKALGMENSFMNLLEFGTIDITRGEVNDPSCLKRVCADIKGQISEENIRALALRYGDSIPIAPASCSTYSCSYLRLGGVHNELIEKHQSVPIFFGPVPKVDVRAGGGMMEFIVAGLPECEILYNAVKTGLAETGFSILNEERLLIEMENDMLTVIPE